MHPGNLTSERDDETSKEKGRVCFCLVWGLVFLSVEKGLELNIQVASVTEQQLTLGDFCFSLS